MLTTVIGAFPKPSFLKITDWFNASGGTDTANPTKFYEEEIKKMGDKAEEIFAKAAKRTFMSCEKIIPTEDFLKEGSVHTLKIPRLFVDGVIEAPRGANFTECPPDYGRDEVFQSEYAASAKDLQSWENFKQKYIEVTDHQEYLKAVDSRTQIGESQNG